MRDVNQPLVQCSKENKEGQNRVLIPTVDKKLIYPWHYKVASAVFSLPSPWQFHITTRVFLDHCLLSVFPIFLIPLPYKLTSYMDIPGPMFQAAQNNIPIDSFWSKGFCLKTFYCELVAE